jgi:hypothetical protein
MKESENNSIFKPRVLTLEDLPWLLEVGRVENGSFVFERSFKGAKLRTFASVPIEKILQVGHGKLIKFIVTGLISERPKLLPFVFESRALVEMARRMERYGRSPRTFYLYVDLDYHYSQRIGKSPDELIAEVKDSEGLPSFDRIQAHTLALVQYIDELRDKGLAPNRIANYAKAIKALYGANNVDIKIPYSLPRAGVGEIEALTSDDLITLLDCAEGPRDKFIVAAPPLGGFRPGTFVQLRYRHVKEDLERGMIPVHIHVEKEITKGKYHDYDTFLGPEAVHYLKLYLDSRRNGSLSRKIPPEEIHDESPLIRDSRSKEPKPIGEKQVHKLIQDLYLKSGLLKQGERYKLTVTSLRKFFKTQMTPRVQKDGYVEYMMGHTVSTYQKIKSLGPEHLRGVYVTANLRIRPEPNKDPRLEQLKAFARGIGLNPEQCIMEGAFAEPHRTFVPGELEDQQIALLSSAIKDAIKQEVLAELRGFESPEIHGWSGAAAGI